MRYFKIILILFIACSCDKTDLPEFDNWSADPYYYVIKTSEDIDTYFNYSPFSFDIIPSGHRGGNLSGFPENCIETFDKLLHRAPFFYEIDLRLTKDNIPVLLHDPTLERTSTGHGSLSDFTYQEIRQLYLKDFNGNISNFRIPSFVDALEWGKDKVIFSLDRKDVSIEQMCSIIIDSGAKNCVFIVNSPEEAKSIQTIIPDARFCAYMGTTDKFREYESSGLLPFIVIAFLESHIVSNSLLQTLIHNAGIRGMVSIVGIDSPDNSKKSRNNAIGSIINSRPDIIESDYPSEICEYPYMRTVLSLE